MCMEKEKTSSVYDIKGEEKTSRTSENKEKARYDYVCIYKCGKKFCTSTFKRAWVAQETTISQIK